MTEIWKDIQGYEDSYQISNLGRVKSLDRMVWNGQSYWNMKGRMLKLTNDKDGYLLASLHLCGKAQTLKVHRLVAIHFIDNPNNLPEVNHKKGNKKDNRYTQLEWCTRKENTIHAIKTGLRIFKTGKENGNYGKRKGKLNPMYGITGDKNSLSKKVRCITTGEEFGSTNQASISKGVNRGSISRCCNGKLKYCGISDKGEKLVWEYI